MRWRDALAAVARSGPRRAGGVGSAAVEPSSANLHPDDGGRFVFERASDDARYDIQIFLPDGVRHHGALLLTPDGATIELGCDEPWVQAEVEKLARVVKRTGQQRLLRWRPRP